MLYAKDAQVVWEIETEYRILYDAQPAILMFRLQIQMYCISVTELKPTISKISVHTRYCPDTKVLSANFNDNFSI